MSSPHDQPVTFAHGPGTNVPANPLGSPLATTPAATGGEPAEQIDHTVGPYPRIDYAPGTVSDPSPLDIGSSVNKADPSEWDASNGCVIPESSHW